MAIPPKITPRGSDVSTHLRSAGYDEAGPRRVTDDVRLVTYDISPVTIYGIRNCDTMKKARTWRDAQSQAYTFHDYKTEGIARERAAQRSRDALHLLLQEHTIRQRQLRRRTRVRGVLVLQPLSLRLCPCQLRSKLVNFQPRHFV